MAKFCLLGLSAGLDSCGEFLRGAKCAWLVSTVYTSILQSYQSRRPWDFLVLYLGPSVDFWVGGCLGFSYFRHVDLFSVPACFRDSSMLHAPAAKKSHFEIQTLSISYFFGANPESDFLTWYFLTGGGGCLQHAWPRFHTRAWSLICNRW